MRTVCIGLFEERGQRMEKYLKYFNEVQIMRNGMEQVKTDNGSVSVEPQQAFAGEETTVTITYTVGEEPIYIGGVLRFTIPFGFIRPQITMPIFPGYTTAKTSRKNASVKTFIVENDWWKRGPDRTKPENVSEHVGTHVWVRVLGHDLKKGDTVTLTYGDTSYHRQAAAQVTRVSGHAQFDVATDQRGNLEAPYSGYYLTENPPTMEILPLKAEALEVILPSETEPGKDTQATVFAIDRYHNLAVGHRGILRCTVGEQTVYEGMFCEEDCGVKRFSFQPEDEGILNMQAEGENIRGISNPCISKKDQSPIRHFWGDMHGHTGIQWGKGSGRSYYEFASKVASVDFCALTDPDAGRYTNNNETAYQSLSCYMTDKQWKEIQDLNKAFYEKGKFVPILGYEYHNDAPAPEFGGDRNVYYESYDEPIRRCVDEGSYCPRDLWNQLKEKKVRALTIPHHTAKKVMLGSWEIHDEEIQRLVEIYSSWGNSEGEGCERPIIGGAVYENHSVQYALNKGYRLGFVTGSDTHGGTPGYAHWVFPESVESYRGGLTCVMTDRLDKESIFQALWDRKVYATTGERILLEFSVNGTAMGQEGSLEENPVRKLDIRVIGTDEIEEIDVISMGHVIWRKEGDAREMEVSFTDETQPAQGWLYYYVRIHQKDKAMAWSSPIWFS